MRRRLYPQCFDVNVFTDSTQGDANFEGCVAVSEIAKNTRQPADIIFSIDNTKSMRAEILWTRNNLNKFSQTIAAEGLHPRIVMLSCRDGDTTCLHSQDFGICVDDPLGALGACPSGDDTNLPSYLHVSVRVPSQKALMLIDENYDRWRGILRPNAVTHLVVISDDGDLWSSKQFLDSMAAKGVKNFQFHSVYSYLTKEAACAISKDNPCCEFGAPQADGVLYDSYKNLVETTGGIGANLCEQNFEPVFQQWAQAVVESAQLSCEWVIPTPPSGETLDPNRVNVEFLDPNLNGTLYGRVDSQEDCADVADAWYYDNAQNPTKVYVCPETCKHIQGQVGAQINIQFGCATEIALPK